MLVQKSRKSIWKTVSCIVARCGEVVRCQCHRGHVQCPAAKWPNGSRRLMMQAAAAARANAWRCRCRPIEVVEGNGAPSLSADGLLVLSSYFVLTIIAEYYRREIDPGRSRHLQWFVSSASKVGKKQKRSRETKRNRQAKQPNLLPQHIHSIAYRYSALAHVVRALAGSQQDRPLGPFICIRALRSAIPCHIPCAVRVKQRQPVETAEPRGEFGHKCIDTS